MERIKLYGGLNLEMELPPSGLPIEEVSPPRNVIIPLSDKDGLSCRPLVEKGETVAKGERIGEDSDRLMLPIH